VNALTLSRIQFAFTVGYHFIYVPLSIGLALMVVIHERRYYKSGAEADKAASNFWIKLFAATFAVGVATGITMEFAFGTNWANYSRFVGNIFGAPLAAEALTSFFLESTFLGILLFGRRRFGKKLYYASAWLVLIGSHLSALWIIIANSWQQTPRGFKVENGKAVLTSFWHAAFNPSTAPRYVHTVVATWIAGSFLVAGISAWYLLKGRHVHFARRWLRTALVVGVVVSVAMPVIGDWHAKEVAAQQPIKLAAFEGIYNSETDAPLTLLGYVNSKAHKTIGIRIPGLLSFLSYGSTSDEVKGLTSVAANDRPPEQIVFQSYHLMVGLGMLFALLMIVALALDLLKQLERRRWLLHVLVWAIPFPTIAILLGWIAAEVGRQPWVVQGLLRTSRGVSPVVSTAEVGLTLGIFFVIYALLFVAWFRIFTNLVRKGPQDVAETLTAQAEPAAAGEAGPATVS
jgi:cytochrome d ubiquinol oxidase subunit I